MNGIQKQFSFTRAVISKSWVRKKQISSTAWRSLQTVYAASLLPLLLLALPTVVKAADYIYTTNNGTIAITKYIGSGGVVIIPNTLSGRSVVNVGDSRSLKSGREAMVRILHDAPDVDAIFCSSDLLALGVMTEARAQGVAVPERVAIVGFGDVPFLSDMVPSLSTVRINGADIGRQAARFLIDRAEGRAVDPRVVDVGFAIIERDTT